MANIIRRTWRDKTTGKLLTSDRWYLSFTDSDGRHKKTPLATDKRASEVMARKILSRVDAGELGIDVDALALRRQPLVKHLQAFETHLRTKENRGSDRHIRRTMARVRRIVDGAAWTKANEINAEGVQAQLSALRDEGMGTQTRAYYLREIRGFVAWMIATKRLVRDNPLAGLASGDPESDRRRLHRVLTDAELLSLVDVARTSPKAVMGLTGTDRYWLYTVAACTGYRPIELSHLRPADFKFDGSPRAELAPEHTKNRKGASQPLPADVCPGLALYLASKPADRQVWPGSWKGDAAELLRVDAAVAKIATTERTPRGPAFLTFYSLRHTFVALMHRAGLPLQYAMLLARHSDAKLTTRIYGQASAADLGAAVNRLAIGQLTSARPVSLPMNGAQVTNSDTAEQVAGERGDLQGFPANAGISK